jgi:adenine/guanine phosphoribosyltransferase-like PRPP-binding protein
MGQVPYEAYAATVFKYASTYDKMYMTIGEAIDLSHEVADRLKSLCPNAKQVVGIARGALLLTSVVARDLGLPMMMISVRRSGNAVKDRVRKIPRLVHLASRWYENERVNTLLRLMIERFNSKGPVLAQEIDTQFASEVILLDDAEESGRTFTAARGLLLRNGAVNITFAVLVWSTLADNFGRGSHAHPDVYIGRSMQHFPWSGNSPYYKEYLKWLADHDLRL